MQQVNEHILAVGGGVDCDGDRHQPKKRTPVPDEGMHLVNKKKGGRNIRELAGRAASPLRETPTTTQILPQ